MPENNIQFLLNDELIDIRHCDPNMTVLDYLRLEQVRRGTKEGCASGDCGACSVVLGQLSDDQHSIVYKSINACISFLSVLHGRQLITVEDLQQGNKLHSVQQAMVDCHGSQCGYCTPGFVMSLFALKKNSIQQQSSKQSSLQPSLQSQSKPPSRVEIEHALAGNLCRCTGYKSIINAAEQACRQNEEDQFDVKELKTIEKLKTIAQVKTLITLEKDNKKLLMPTSMKALNQLIKQYPKAKLLAGGTDLALSITQQMNEIEILIYLSNIPELTAIEELSNSLMLGAAVSYQSCYSMLEGLYPEFSQMINRLGSTQVRNLGTLGGNIGNASPIGDVPPVLQVLDAKLMLHKDNITREVAINDFFIDYKITALEQGEFIQTIEIPKPLVGYQLKVFKISKRIDDDISTVLGCFYIKLSSTNADTNTKSTIEDIRIAYGGMAAISKRAKHCEQALIGKIANESTIIEAMKALEQDFTPMSDVRASSDYRMMVAKNLIRKCFAEVLEPQLSLRVEYHA